MSDRTITIGMPLHNNAATVAAAIQSLRGQTHQDFTLRISDDCSSDRTPEICEDLARSDSRILVQRQTRNLGYGNFRHLLMSSETPYFMWAAGDDWWAPAYVERCIAALEADRNAVCAVSRCQFYAGKDPVYLAKGTSPLLGSVQENLWRYLSAPRDNTRMYGVFRTAVAQRSFPEDEFYAYDWAFSAATLVHGHHIEVPDILLHRDRTPPEKYVELVRRDAHSALERALPLLPMTRWLLQRARIPFDLRIAGALFELNIEKHWEYASRFMPRYARIAEPVHSMWSRLVAWRLMAGHPD